MPEKPPVVREATEARVRFGLRAQGHTGTIDRMLADAGPWDAIGKAIGWHPPTAREWHERDLKHDRAWGEAMHYVHALAEHAPFSRRHEFIEALKKRVAAEKGVGVDGLWNLFFLRPEVIIEVAEEVIAKHRKENATHGQ